MKIKSIRRIRETVSVYDLQTGTENFFSEGVLVHNCFTDAILTSPYSGWCSVSCPFSLPAGEMVDTPNGPQAIETFKVGDLVWGRDLAKGQNVSTRVLGTLNHLKQEGYLTLTWNNGVTMRLTSDHPVWSPMAANYVHASTVGFGLTKDSRTVEVESRKAVEDSTTVYDIQTETGNFYLRGVLVSNCYVNSGFRGYRGSGLIAVPLDYGKQIGKQLSRMRRSAAGYFSSFTDPFLPLEGFYHNTQEAATEFVKVGLPIFFLSRLRYPDWAVDLLKENPHSYAQKSINTSVQEDWKYLSPGAISLEEHFEDIRRLKRNGIYVSIQCNPIIAGVTSHSDIYHLFKRLAEVGADHVIVKFVEAGYSWAPTMIKRMVNRFGERGERFGELFTQNIGAERTVEERYRLQGHKHYSRWAKELGLTYATCYEYKYERDAEGKILSKVGVSIGREFATSDQCHGHRVPIYTRNSENEMFRPLEECPPSGCLYCADENEENPGKARCGDELMGQANALRYADFKKPIGEGKARLFGLPVIKAAEEGGGCGDSSCG